MADTIVAIATAMVPQQGSVGIVRVSGTEAVAIAQQLFQTPGQQQWQSHRVLYGYIQEPKTQLLVDEALVLIMLAPRSYTREDVVEFHCHGGLMVVQRVVQLCVAAGARLAQPGEFTLRAFLNGRIDLTQAEGVADLVGAQSPQAAQIALAGVRGKLAQPIRRLRSLGLELLAEVEARLDFEEDLPPLDEAWMAQQLAAMVAEVEQILATAERGELLRGGLKVAIVGRPNVGKSSLLNAWSRSDRAIVTDIPGTTRDVVESSLVVGGIPVQVLDTAGIRETEDQVERLGVERSRQAIALADVVLLVVSAAEGWQPEDTLLYEAIAQEHSVPLLIVVNKSDLLPPDQADWPDSAVLTDLGIPAAAIAAYPTVRTAAALNQGIDVLETAFLAAVHQERIQSRNLDLAINQRQAAALTQAHQALQQVQQTLGEALPLDFWTIDLRAAIQALGEITGDSVTESVLDRIFSRFCIGK